MYQQNDFDSEDTEIFAKMMFLCTEGRLRDLEELIDNYDQDSIDDDKIKYNSAQHMILQNAQDLNTGKRIIDIAALNGHLAPNGSTRDPLQGITACELASGNSILDPQNSMPTAESRRPRAKCHRP